MEFSSYEGNFRDYKIVRNLNGTKENSKRALWEVK